MIVTPRRLVIDCRRQPSATLWGLAWRDAILAGRCDLDQSAVSPDNGLPGAGNKGVVEPYGPRNPATNLSSSGKSPVSCFEYTSLPSTLTSKMPPVPPIKEASSPSALLILAAKLTAFGS